jgi:GR25 family glycosyltransferase involved in LPS biosynthesis
MSKKTICLTMIVKNESHIIKNTLDHLWKYIKFDTWFISDTGSTDTTKEIITDFFKERGVEGTLQEEPWRDFGYNRTKAFEGAYKKADYAFVWDADDEIHGNFKLPDDLSGDVYKFIFSDGSITYSRPQLFNMNKRWCYKGVLHEYAECLEECGNNIDVIGDYFFRSGRTGNRSKNPNKYLDDAIILEKASEKALIEGDSLYNRYIFYCAKSYSWCNKREKAIEFYKKSLELPLWSQEKYVSCLSIFQQYNELQKPEEGIYYLIKSYKYDRNRMECFYELIKYYCVEKMNDVAYMYYTAIQNFYENEYDESTLSNKLFANKTIYDFFLPYYMIIVSISTDHLKTASKMYECIFKYKYEYSGEWWNRNLIFNMQFCINELPFDLKFLDDCFTYLNMVIKNGVNFEKVQLEVIDKLIDRYKPLISSKPIPNSIELKPKTPVNIIITFTTCKRFDLFEKTMNSLLHMWSDLHKIDYFYCVDDNSCQRDRTKMKTAFPFIDFYMKRVSEKGHRISMNLIYNKIKELNPKYWIHMEDDWLFFQKDCYVQKSVDFLEKNENLNIHQILYNRNYAEKYTGYLINGGIKLEDQPDFFVHEKSNQVQGTNCAYWPHYSFRPSMCRVSSILTLGNYDSPNTFFERDYADRYFEKGYKSAFFNIVCSLHIGKLTSDKSGTNAYTLNNTMQFNEDNSKKKLDKVFIVNLLRRTDRKEKMENEFEKAGISELEYEFFEAIDGKDLECSDEIITLFKGNDFGSRKGFLGCALSHYNLWKQLLESKCDYYTIFEDDINLCDGFKEKWEKEKNNLEEVDVLFLGYTMYDKNKNEKYKQIIDSRMELDLQLYIGGFYGYIITQSGAKKLLEYIGKNGIKHGVDYLIKIVPGLKLYNIQPHVVFTEWVSSFQSNVDTDIQKDYSSIDIQWKVNENDWIFYKGLDSGGNDIKYVGKKSHTELMKDASLYENCIAFNTLGFLKSSIKFSLHTSPYFFNSDDGLYIKKSYTPVIPSGTLSVPFKTPSVAPLGTSSTRIKMMCNWCSSEDLCKEWLKMTRGFYKWNNLEITWLDSDIDYYIIINKPMVGENYEPEKTIVYHMEPWCNEDYQKWGVKTWGDWARPDPRKFFQVRTHDLFVNNVFWQLNLTYDEIKDTTMSDLKTYDIVSSICSSKYFDPGHKKRIDFLKYLECKEFPIHIYNEDNNIEFKSYKGKARPFVDKEKAIIPYKYYFMCENNAEHNFVTEKLWEPILCESLCFYWGCPNVNEIVDPLAFVQLDMNHFEGSYLIMKEAIEMNLWETRLPHIKAAKQKLLDQSFFPTLEKVLKPKIVCFIHSCHLPESGTEKLDLVLDAVLKIKELEIIFINNIGLKLDSRYNNIDPRIVLYHSSDNHLEFELPTLRLLHQFSMNTPNTKILYVHSKGISYSKDDFRYEPVLDWINYMLYFLCENSNKCIELLNCNDVAGCNYSESPFPHFSGNFWWATTKYLKSLDTSSLTNKMSAEWWLHTKNPTKSVLWNSEKDHFHNKYRRDMYSNINII